MNFGIWAFCAFVAFWCTSCFAVKEYIVTLESMDNHPEASREYVDWHFRLVRVNKTEKVPRGYFKIKKELVKPRFTADSFVKLNGKFLSMGLNLMRTVSLCSEPVMNLMKYFKGNATIDSENCTAFPGYMELPEDLDFSPTEFTRGGFKNILLGTYKFDLKVQNDKDIVVSLFGFIVNVLPKK